MPTSRQTMFAERMRDLRRRRGIDQDVIAKATGCSVRTVYGWESGTTDPPASAILLIADVLGITTDYLLGRSDTEQVLAPQTWLVDVDLVDAIKAGRVEPSTIWATPVPDRHITLSSTQYAQLAREIAAKRKAKRKRKR